MADDRLIPSSIADERSLAFLALIERLGSIDLTPLLVYRTASTPTSALYALAWQFGVTGLAGWDLADTEQKRRELVTRAIEFHRKKGTAWVIREALKAVGYPDSAVIENFGRPLYDGSQEYDGAINYHVGSAWGDFAVDYGAIADDTALDSDLAYLLRAVVEVWKRASSRLVQMGFTQALEPDQLPSMVDQGMPMVLKTYFGYDGEYSYDGEVTYVGYVPQILASV